MYKPLANENIPLPAESFQQALVSDRAEARKHRIAERLALGDSRETAERYADVVDAWLRRLDAEERAAGA